MNINEATEEKEHMSVHLLYSCSRLQTHSHMNAANTHTYLKHNPDIGGDGETLAIRQREQLVVIQHGVEVFHPLRVHITVKDDPLPFVDFPTHIVNDLPMGAEVWEVSEWKILLNIHANKE